MLNYEYALKKLIETLRKNIEILNTTKPSHLPQVRPPKSPGVYMLFFEGKLQYIGFSGNIKERIRNNLLNGDRESHTLINKLCWEKERDKSEIVKKS